ncbi:hypothetical protein EUAN_15250 [Andreesenia angusta]|uniref:Uncharacterized protein n=1 Tax=Andreesenia angusta TaxID=39480 RepID=A0A1S1V7E0_9FIRM|nr:DUF5693 family protein [Andreesenia angusta]OHW62077.1 hypothetical protein EUAN_15250 [Andreesenia angusta]
MIKNNRMIIILLIASLLSSSLLMFNRISTEMNDRKIDFVLDYYEIEKLAEQSDKSLGWWLEKLGNMGASAVAINYETIRSMKEERDGISTVLLYQLKKEVEWEQNYPKEVVDYINSPETDKYDILVSVDNFESFDFIAENMKSKYGKKVSVFRSEENGYLVIDGGMSEALYPETEYLIDEEGNKIAQESNMLDSKVEDLNIGLDPEKLEVIKESGLEVLPRISNTVEGWNGKSYFNSIVEEYKDLENRSDYLIFGGKEILGHSDQDDRIDEIEELINSEELKLGIVETDVQRSYISQKGMNKLLERLDYSAVKVFSIAPYIQERYKYYNYEGSEEIENTIYRGVTERNIKLVYFRPFKSEEKRYVTELGEYERMFSSLANRLEDHGISYGEAVPFKSNHVNKILGIIAGTSAVALGLILLERLFNVDRKIRNLAAIAGLLGVAVLGLFGGSLGYMVIALLVSIVFPSVSMVYLVGVLKSQYLENGGDVKRAIVSGSKALVVTSLISLTGALVVGAIMSDIVNLLDIKYFQGVKLSQMAPIVVYMLLFLGYFGYKSEKSSSETRATIEDFKEVLQDNVKVLYMIIAVAIAGAGYVYLARTGHESNIQPSELEMIFRNTMELKFLARPRTKEFLIAFPAIVVGTYMAVKRWKLGVFIAGLAAVIGQTSIINTFSHFKTPIYISFARTVYSLVIGLALGVLYTFALYALIRLFGKTKGETSDE